MIFDGKRRLAEELTNQAVLEIPTFRHLIASTSVLLGGHHLAEWISSICLIDIKAKTP
jgi:hypothetical protein